MLRVWILLSLLVLVDGKKKSSRPDSDAPDDLDAVIRGGWVGGCGGDGTV